MQAGFRESALTQVVHSISSIVIVTNKVSNAYHVPSSVFYKYNLINLHNKLMNWIFPILQIKKARNRIKGFILLQLAHGRCPSEFLMDPYVRIYLEQLNIPAKSKEMKQQQQQIA